MIKLVWQTQVDEKDLYGESLPAWRWRWRWRTEAYLSKKALLNRILGDNRPFTILSNKRKELKEIHCLFQNFVKNRSVSKIYHSNMILAEIFPRCIFQDGWFMTVTPTR